MNTYVTKPEIVEFLKEAKEGEQIICYLPGYKIIGLLHKHIDYYDEVYYILMHRNNDFFSKHPQGAGCEHAIKRSLYGYRPYNYYSAL